MPQQLITMHFPRKKGKRNLSLSFYRNYNPIQIKVDNQMGASGFACLHADASFTVEAALVLPIVLLVCVAVLYFFRLLQVETCVQSALNNSARETAVYAGELAGLSETEETLLLHLAAVEKTKKYVKSSGCDYSFIKQGLNGLSFLESEYEDEKIQLRVTYHMKLPVSFFGKRDFAVTQESSACKWIGKTDQEEDGTQSEWVYITPNGTAYHKTDACSYLKLSIQKVSKTKVGQMRNASGGKYYPCTICGAQNASMVYVTDYGTNYHALAECSGLKRTIYYVRLETISGYHPCGKCYGS